MEPAKPAKRITVEDRERAIFKYLKGLEDRARGASVKEIWKTVAEALNDTVSQQAYYKLLDRMVAVGKLDRVDDGASDASRRYVVAPHLTAENAVTLDDVYEMLEALSPSDAIARVLDARDYYEEKRTTTLRRAAEALLDENPLDVVEALLKQKVEELRSDLAILRDKALVDRDLEARVAAQLRELQNIAYRYLGLSRQAIDVANREALMVRGEDVSIDERILRSELEMRVFGDRFIMPVDVTAFRRGKEYGRMTVAGSDASTHASVMQLTTAGRFTDDVGHQVVTFNNSAVFVDVAPDARGAVSFPYYSVPMTRSAIDDKANRGMVLAPFMYRYLSESEYEHMTKCAIDVVQWRADDVVFSGTARSLHDGALLPRPLVQFRDGTITLQEREYGHYKRANEYGDMVRQGFAHTRRILEKIIATPKPPVFAGAVKTTQSVFFSTVLNWYIAKGSRRRFGAPLDPNWDTTRAAHIADNEAMSFLLSTLEDKRKDGLYYVTFTVMRPFHTLTEFYKTPRTSKHDWIAHFEDVREREMKAYRDGLDNDLPHLASIADVADDDFVYLCVNADYAAFFVGHTSGEPPPIAPRYEFLENLRPMRPAAARERVVRNVRLVVEALDRSKFSADKEHNFLSKKFLVKIIPHVIFDAHEKCKALGRQLEAELRSVVIANLQALKNVRSIRVSDVEFLPLSIRRFVERYARVMEEERKRDPDGYSR
jgi:hypothetical protein